MISEEEARSKILATIRPLPNRSVPRNEALNRFAAEDYFARVPLPTFDNSAMDGYAVAAKSCEPGQRLRVVGEQPAGVDKQLRVGEGETVRIFTGAPMPAGADAVVMQEDVTREGDHIVVNDMIETGEFVRRRGCDLGEGQKILSKGERIRAASLALLASQGLSDVRVGGEVGGAIISTGDELVAAGRDLKPGEIYESNSVLLRALVEGSGAHVRSVEHSPDDRASLQGAIERGAKYQVLIISGGVSVGDHDLVKSVLQNLGAKIDIWRVAIKPGKPFLFGYLGECAVFGLPGNPVSGFVTFLRLVRPAIRTMMGASDAELEGWKIFAKLAADVRNDGDRAHYLRGRFGDRKFTPIGRQESHALFGLSQANALLRVAPGEEFKQGAEVEIEIWD